MASMDEVSAPPLPAYPTTTGENSDQVSTYPTCQSINNTAVKAEVTGQISEMTISDQPTSAESGGRIDPSGPSTVMVSSCKASIYSFQRYPLSVISLYLTQEMFQDGVVVVLQSVASRHTLCVSGGEISGKGIRDAFCKTISDFFLLMAKHFSAMMKTILIFI